MKRVTILGATGSIGTSALKFLRLHRDKFSLDYIAVGQDVSGALAIAREFGCKAIAVADEQAGAGHSDPDVKILTGAQGVAELAALPADVVLGAVTGSCGLPAILAAIEAGNDVALANKESLVCGGPNLLKFADDKGVKIIPVDSEHSAIFQCLLSGRKDELEKIILTASGGPFRTASHSELEAATPAQALAHPNWSMGPKNSLDSASLANKGLELIETAYFFDVAESLIDVVVHPTSIFHSAVRYKDGAMIAQLGETDMCGAVGYGLSYPERIVTGLAPLDLPALGKLEFYALDDALFPAVSLARAAIRAGQSGSLTFNAANEIGGAAFLNGQIGFLDIARLIEQCLNKAGGKFTADLPDIVAADEAAKFFATEQLAAFLKQS